MTTNKVVVLQHTEGGSGVWRGDPRLRYSSVLSLLITKPRQFLRTLRCVGSWIITQFRCSDANPYLVHPYRNIKEKDVSEEHSGVNVLGYQSDNNHGSPRLPTEICLRSISSLQQRWWISD